MLFFGKRKKEEDDEFFVQTDDVIVIFDDDKRTSTIERVSYIKENTIYVTGKHAVPLQDVEVTNGVEGRIFFYRAPTLSITQTERLAALEMSMVLKQVTAYNPPINQTGMDWTKSLLFGLVFIAFIVIGFSGCSMGGLG